MVVWGRLEEEEMVFFRRSGWILAVLARLQKALHRPLLPPSIRHQNQNLLMYSQMTSLTPSLLPRSKPYAEP